MGGDHLPADGLARISEVNFKNILSSSNELGVGEVLPSTFLLTNPEKVVISPQQQIDREGTNMGMDAKAFVFFGFVLEEEEVRGICKELNLKEFGVFTVEDAPGEVLAPFIKNTFRVPVSFVVGGMDSSFHYCFILGNTYTAVYAPEYPKMFRTRLTEDLVLSADALEQGLKLVLGAIDWHVGALYL